MVELYFLGTGNAFGHGGRLQSCYIIKGKKTILLDAGLTTFPALRNNEFNVLDIDVILLSHLHPDHYGFLPQIVLEDYYVVKRNNQIPVYGPIGTNEKILDITRIMYNEEVTEHVNTIFRFHEHGINQVFGIPGGEVETLPASHSPEARMQIISIDGKKIGYTGDTALVKDSFYRLLDCDIIITEASSFSHSIPDHTSYLQLQELQIPSDKQIYLTHVGDSIISSSDKILPPFYLASDGMKLLL